MLLETLRADWAARATHARVSALPEFAAGALTLGAGTQLAEARADRRDAAAEGERAVALVSVALGRPLDASAATHVRRALARARAGDAPLALTPLALAGAGRLTEPHEDARRLFVADGLMKAGVSPSTIVAALGAPLTQSDLDRAYNPDQPRVPAGNGRESGQWTSGDSAAEASGDRSARAAGDQVADSSSTQGREVRSDASSTSAAPSAPDKPSALQTLLTGFWNALPGTHYSALAVQAWHSGDYLNFALYEGAATLEAALILVPAARVASTGAEAVSASASAALQTLTLSDRRAIQLAANKLAGKAFDNQVGDRLEALGVETADETTVQTMSGAKTRLDHLFRDPTNNAIRCIESKSSETAPLTPKQEVAFPEIESSGATIVGAGKPGFPGGTVIPPTKVEVIRPSNLDDLNFWTPP
ncbi:MAG: hypothetical protein ABSF67_03645 [Roseiarcus sp.]|jgi:hypothetical protein